MENTTPSVKQIAIHYGVLLALVSILTLLTTYVANIEKSWTLSILAFGLTVLIFVYALKTYKQNNMGFLSVGEAIKVGLATAAVGGLISALYTWLHYNFVYPEYLEVILENARLQMEEQSPEMGEEQMEMAMSMTEKMTTPFMMATFSLIGSLFFGFIISVVAGLIMKTASRTE